MISVVCVYNNERLLEDYLVKSLNRQTVEFEFISLDNTSGSFGSASEALNHGGKKAKGKYIMFVHQDVDLSSNSWLEDAEKSLDTINNLGIAGVAGMSETGNTNEKRGRNIIKHGNPVRIWQWGNQIQKPEQVQTLDECLVIIPKKVFDVIQFDEIACNNWDLYAVDYCLSIKKLGLEAYALPMHIYHKSTGKITKNYYLTLEKLKKKHREKFKHIYTTFGDWNTSHPLIFQRLWHLMKARLTYPFRKLQNRVD